MERKAAGGNSGKTDYEWQLQWIETAVQEAELCGVGHGSSMQEGSCRDGCGQRAGGNNKMDRVEPQETSRRQYSVEKI